MNRKEDRFFRIAREMSLISNHKKTRVGAVVVQSGHIIGSGHNAEKTRPLQQRYNVYREFSQGSTESSKQHAEVDAISPLIGKDIDWKKVSVFVYRTLRDGERGCSRPCQACRKLMIDLGITVVYYIDEQGNYVKEKIL